MRKDIKAKQVYLRIKASWASTGNCKGSQEQQMRQTRFSTYADDKYTWPHAIYLTCLTEGFFIG